MGYIFAVFSLFSGLIKGFCGKKISGLVSSIKGTFFMNMLRMLLCVAVGYVIVTAEGSSIAEVNPHMLFISAVSGISTALFVVSWIFCVRRGAYVMVDVFLMLGGGLTIALCKIFFGEAVSAGQLAGYILLVIASYIMCSYSAKIKGSFSFASFFFLVAGGVCNALADFSQKWFIYTFPDGKASVFNLYTYLFGAIVLLISFVIANKAENKPNDGKSVKVFLVICIMAVCLFAYSYFKTLAAKTVPSAFLYPFTSGASIVLSALMAALFFKEKITARCAVGIVIALCAIVVMNV